MCNIAVAPLVGAWIEIFAPFTPVTGVPVAPLVGAWIEIFYDVDQADVAKVAPLVGAWIEISKKATACSAVRQSLLSWERGLK